MASGLLAAVLMLAGCKGTEVQLPKEPDSFAAPEYYGFGDAIGARDTKAWTEVWDVLEPKYGKLRHGVRELPASVAPATIEAELGARLRADGWTTLPELARWDRSRRSYAFGWVKAGKVYAIVGLDHDPAVMARSPVNIITNIAGETTYVARSEGDS